jgi:thioredoxin 1
MAMSGAGVVPAPKHAAPAMRGEIGNPHSPKGRTIVAPDPPAGWLAAAAAGNAPAGSRKSKAHGPGVVSCAIHGLLTGGRAGAKLTRIRDEADFDQRVLQADRPVLVVFYKGGCPTCLLLHPGLKQLADEYRDRVVFAAFELMKPYFVVTSREVKKRYHVAFYPTVILFVNGQEKDRWVLGYHLAAYRKALDEVAGPPPP